MLDSASAYIVAKLEATLEEERRLKNLYRELAAMPEGSGYGDNYVGKEKQWLRMTQERRENMMEIVDQSLEHYADYKKRYESAVDKESVKQGVYAWRPVARRVVDRYVPSRKVGVLHPRRSVARKKGVRRHMHPRRKV